MNPVSLIFLATFVEGLTEYVFSGFRGVKYIALALGVVAAVAYNVDVLAVFGLTSGFPYVNQVVSGLIIGRGSNYLNDIISKFRT